MKKDQSTSRREFLKTGAAGLAGAAFLPAIAWSRPMQETQRKDRKFICRTLGRTGLRLPIVSMGATNAINLVRTALEEGIVHIDTSSIYYEGNHERMIGEVFKDLPRDSFVIATSVDLRDSMGRIKASFEDIKKNITPDFISEAFDGSLQRLGLDYVDIYYLANVDSREYTLYKPYMKVFEEFKRAGKARFVGITTHSNEPEVIRAGAESKHWDVVLTTYNFRQTHHKEIQEAIRQGAEAGIGIVAMKTQAGVYWDKARTKKINMKAALKLVLQDENVHTAVPAFSNYEQMMDDLSVMEDLTLTPEEKRDLKLGWELGFSGLYCQQCGSCLNQCKADLDIPTLMRSYMYAFGYQDPKKAKDTLRYWTSSDIPCNNCRMCEVRCSLGFDVKSRAVDIGRILEVPEEFLG